MFPIFFGNSIWQLNTWRGSLFEVTEEQTKAGKHLRGCDPSKKGTTDESQIYMHFPLSEP